MNNPTERIKALAKEKNIKLGELAREIGVNENIFSTWKSKNPSLETIAKIATYFGVSIDYLMSLTNQRNIYFSESQEIAELFDLIKSRNFTTKQAKAIIDILNCITLIRKEMG